MRYFCIGSGIPVIELSYSPCFLDTFPAIKTPILKKLSVTQTKATAAFNDSVNFIVVRTLEDAIALRHAKINNSNKGGHPLEDFAIYEINSDIEINFIPLKKQKLQELDGIISIDLQIKAYNDRSLLPDIEFSIVPKQTLCPQLVNNHYFSLDDGHDIFAEPESTSKSCTIL